MVRGGTLAPTVAYRYCAAGEGESPKGWSARPRGPAFVDGRRRTMFGPRVRRTRSVSSRGRETSRSHIPVRDTGSRGGRLGCSRDSEGCGSASSKESTRRLENALGFTQERIIRFDVLDGLETGKEIVFSRDERQTRHVAANERKIVRDTSGFVERSRRQVERGHMPGAACNRRLEP